MRGRPTPADLAKADDLRRQSESPIAIVDALKSQLPDLIQLLESCGVSIRREVDDWVRLEGAEAVVAWTQIDSASQTVARLWKDTVTQRQTGLLAAVVKETRLSHRVADVGPNFRQYGLTYAGVIRHARLDAGYQFLRTGKDLPLDTSLDRDHYLRLLELASLYLGNVVAGDRLDGKTPSPDLLGRFGVAVILRGRFRRQSISELREACRAIDQSIAGGNTHNAAYEYYVEGLTQLYDISGEREVLSDAAKFVQTQGDGPDSRQWHMNAAEVWMKLLEVASPSARPRFVELARDSLERARGSRDALPSRSLRLVMLEALRSWLAKEVERGVPISCRGFAFPFGVRTRTAQLPGSVARATDDLVEALRGAADAGDYLPREISADLLSFRGRQRSAGAHIADLERATDLRLGKPWQSTLVGERSELSQAEDLLDLANLKSDVVARHSAIDDLIGHWNRWPNSAAAITVIALDVETNGPVGVETPFRAAAGLPSPRMVALVRAIRGGASATIYALAAAIADSSPHVGRRGIGGRSEVVAIDDSFGAGQTFVFKPMSRQGSIVDEDQGRAIANRIQLLGRESDFGVIEHLAVVEANLLGIQLDPRYDVIGVQKFVDASSLLDYALGAGVQTGELLQRAAQFLALIHSLDSRGECPDGCRRQIRERDVRYWLRRITPSQEGLANELFEQWWQLVQDGSHFFRRRDAHVENWLVENSGRIVAVDLDCTGWRPLGYELAQLTDDHALIDPEDWDARSEILDSYLSELQSNGVVCDRDQATRMYQAGLIARTVRTFSLAENVESKQVHATLLLQWLARNSAFESVRSVATKVLDVWGILSGLGIEDRLELLKTPERRRISRAMAYHLRHDPSAPISREGWMHVDELAQILRAAGHRVTSQQLLVIAGAMGEPRFEISDKDVRAVYGHSLPLAIKYSSPPSPPQLFHGTATSNLRSVAEARDGLRSMGRQYVHLTSNRDTAIRAASRRQESTVVLRVATAELEGLKRASEETWLVDRVPVTSTEVVAQWELAPTRR